MSIDKMIALHPQVPDGDGAGDTLSTAARHAMFCSAMCISCADACSAEAMDMAQCIRTCMECADICAATARLAIRRTGDNAAMVRALLETCIRACEICAGECDRHDHEHCRLCATMCRECAEDCRKALTSIDA